MQIEPRTDARRPASESLRQAALVAGVEVGRAMTAADGTLTRVVRRLPRPLLAVAGLFLAAGAAVLFHRVGGGAAAPLGGGVSHVGAVLPRDEVAPSVEG